MHWIQIIYSLDTLQDQYIFLSDLKEIKTVGKKRKRSQKKQNEVKTKSKNENTRQNQLQVSSQFA